MLNKTGSTTPPDVVIECRAPTFDFDPAVAGRWNDGSAVKSHFWNALSMGLPQLEHAAVSTIHAVLPQLSDDPELKHCARAFCMQESQHAIKHGTFNRSLPSQATDPQLQWDARLFRWLMRVTPRRFMLGLFSGVEHFTSIVAHAGLEAPDRWFRNCEPEVYRLWDWHAVEELEHKSVCFDVYQRLGGSWLLRCGTMLLATFLILLPTVFVRWLRMLRRDGVLWTWRTWRDMGHMLVARDHGLVPVLWRGYLSYFRIGFQPWEQDSRALITKWRQAALKAPVQSPSSTR